MPPKPIRDSSLGREGVREVREDTAVTIDRHQAEAKGFGNLIVGVDQLSLMERPFLGFENSKIREMHGTILSPLCLYFNLPSVGLVQSLGALKRHSVPMVK